MKYRINFQFKLNDGSWADDYFDNNGKGFDYEDAKAIACEIKNGMITQVGTIEVVPV